MKRLPIFLALLLASTAHAQKPAPKPSPSPNVLSAKEQKLQIQKLQVVDLVKKTAEEAFLWDDKPSAVRATVRAADLMWNELPTLAPKWLEKAWRMAGEMEPTEREKSMMKYVNGGQRVWLRRAVLAVAVRRDRKMADRFLKEIADAEAEQKPERGYFDDRTQRSSMLMNAAKATLGTDPELAVSLARQSLQDGISFSLQEFLIKLRAVNPTAANNLFDAAVARLASSPADQMESQVLAGYLFTPGQMVLTTPDGNFVAIGTESGGKVDAIAPGDPARAANFLRVLHQKLFAVSAEISDVGLRRAMFTLANRLMPQFQRYTPEFVPNVTAVMSQLANEFGSEKKQPKFFDEPEDEKQTPEERYEARIKSGIKEAEALADQKERDEKFGQVTLETKADDWKRGLEIAERISDLELRNDVVSFVHFRAAMFYASKKDVKTAQDFIPKIGTHPRAALVAMVLAKMLSEEKKGSRDEVQLRKQNTIELFGEAERTLRNTSDPEANVQIHLALASAASFGYERSRAVAALENAVQQANLDARPFFDLEEFDYELFGVEALPWSMSTVETAPIKFGLKTAIEPLLDDNFDDVASLVERLASRPTRGTARIALAEVFFRKNKVK